MEKMFESNGKSAHLKKVVLELRNLVQSLEISRLCTQEISRRCTIEISM